ASLKPGGAYVAKDLHDAGGIALVAQRLNEGGLINGAARTVDGRTLAQVAAAAIETPGQKVVTVLDKPLKPTGGLAILRGNLAPEAARGGAIAAIQDGDTVTIDVAKRQLNLELPAAEIARRLKTWRPPEPRYPTGVFAKYAALVSSASEGAITRPPRSR